MDIDKIFQVQVFRAYLLRSLQFFGSGAQLGRREQANAAGRPYPRHA